MEEASVKKIRVPGDKSITQRALIVASIASGESRLKGLLSSSDPQSTANVLRALGVVIEALPDDGSELRMAGIGPDGFRDPQCVLDFQNSGTGARLMLGVLSGRSMVTTITGDDSLRNRPMTRVTDPLTKMGARFEFLGESGRLPIEVAGGELRPLQYETPIASAQVKSALLLAAVTSGTLAVVSEPSRSRDHTERILSLAGVPMRSYQFGERWNVELRDPPDNLQPLDLEIPGDFSSAAFLIALALLGGVDGGLRIDRVGLNPTRTGLLHVLARMGGKIDMITTEKEDSWGEPLGTLFAAPSELNATQVDKHEVSGMIDEFPVLAILAARATGTTRITGASELRVKESDRIGVLVENLRRIGVEAEELTDGMEIVGTDQPQIGRVRSHHDHRIAMAFGVLGAVPGNQIEVEDPAVADVSFRGFWEHLRRLTILSPNVGQKKQGKSNRVRAAAGSVITVDGPAGSGKTTTAREVAKRLKCRYLDSGALYRAVTFALLEKEIPPEEWPSLSTEELNRLGLRLELGNETLEVSLKNARLSSELRTIDVTRHVSEVAGLSAVREWLLDVQRDAAEKGGLVADGRDMGTVVFPNAAVKVFLVAGIEERARRRLLQESGNEPSLSEIHAQAKLIERRDRADSGREHAPLRCPEGALELDTTDLTFEGQVALILQHVKDLTLL